MRRPKYRTKNPNKYSLVILIVLLLISLTLVIISAHQPNARSLQNFCKPSGLENGTDVTQVDISKSANYYVWVHLELPLQINFNDLPGVYNPLLVGVDNKTCYKVDTTQPVALNTWVWTNSLYDSSPSGFRINLSKGSHIFYISGAYVSIDRIELLSNNCNPSADGSNCVAPTKSLIQPSQQD